MFPNPQRRALAVLAGVMLVLLTVTQLAAGAFGAGQTGRPIIDGFIRDAVTQQPIANVWVCFAEHTDDDGDGVRQAVHAFTDRNGYYKVSLPSVQFHWRVAASVAGYANAADRMATVPASVDFSMHPVSNTNHYWGQLGGSFAGNQLSGVEVYADADGSEIVAVTDELGRFGVALSATDIVPVSFISPGIGVQHRELNVDSSNGIASAYAVPLDPLVGHDSMTVTAVLASTGAGSGPGSEIWLFSVDGNGDLVHQAEETMTAASTHDLSFQVPDGTTSHVVATNSVGWGSVQVQTGTGVQPTVTVDDMGQASISATLVGEVGLVDPGTLYLEVVIEDASSGHEFAIPFRESAVTLGQALTFGNLPAGEYRLRHENAQYSRFVDQLNLSASQVVAKDYLVTAPVDATIGVGTGVADLTGLISVPDPANTVIDVALIDPVDGRIEESVIAAADGSFQFLGVPAGDWVLNASGVHASGQEFRQMEGAIEIALFTGSTTSLPEISLTASIGLAIRGYAVEYDTDPNVPHFYLMDTFYVTLVDSSGSTMTFQADGFPVLAIGDVPSTTVSIEVDGVQLGSHSFAVDYSTVNANEFFKVYDVVVQ